MTFFISRALGAPSAWHGRAFLALSSLMVVTCFLLAPVSRAHAEMRQLAGGRIAIDLDAKFTPTDSFAGYVDNSSGVSFALIELPGKAYEELKTLPDSEEALAKEGFDGTKKAELKGREGDFFYLVGEQETPVGDVTKFVLVFNEKDVTGVIVVNVPRKAIDDGTYSREGIETILATASVRDIQIDEPDLFRFSYLGPFKEAYDHGGMTKAYNLSGAKPGSGGNQVVKETMLLVSSSLHSEAIDVKAQANKAFAELGGMKDREIDEEKEVTIGKFKGHQISGKATDAESGDEIAIQLVVLSGEPLGYFMLLGSVPAAEKEKMLPEVEKVIASFELVE